MILSFDIKEDAFQNAIQNPTFYSWRFFKVGRNTLKTQNSRILILRNKNAHNR